MSILRKISISFLSFGIILFIVPFVLGVVDGNLSLLVLSILILLMLLIHNYNSISESEYRGVIYLNLLILIFYASMLGEANIIAFSILLFFPIAFILILIGFFMLLLVWKKCLDENLGILYFINESLE